MTVQKKRLFNGTLPDKDFMEDDVVKAIIHLQHISYEKC